MLAQAGLGDVIMAPAADMFEQGVRVQVLKRGTLFASRAARLYEVYRRCADLESIPAARPRRAGEGDLPRAPRDRVGGDARLLEPPRSRRERARRARAAAPHGAGVPLVPRARQPLGHRRRGRPAARLPDLVRTGDGRVQRLDRRLVPGGARGALRRADRAGTCWRAPRTSRAPSSSARWASPSLPPASRSVPGPCGSSEPRVTKAGPAGREVPCSNRSTPAPPSPSSA